MKPTWAIWADAAISTGSQLVIAQLRLLCKRYHAAPGNQLCTPQIIDLPYGWTQSGQGGNVNCLIDIHVPVM